MTSRDTGAEDFLACRQKHSACSSQEDNRHWARPTKVTPWAILWKPPWTCKASWENLDYITLTSHQLLVSLIIVDAIRSEKDIEPLIRLETVISIGCCWIHMQWNDTKQNVEAMKNHKASIFLPAAHVSIQRQYVTASCVLSLNSQVMLVPMYYVCLRS